LPIVGAGLLHTLHGLQDAFVVFRHDLDELRHGLLPICEQSGRKRALRVGLVALNHLPHLFDLVRVFEFLQPNHLEVAAVGEIARLIEYIGDAAGHAGSKITPRRPQNDNAPAGHIFAAVVAG
jgi:hypothetical protein